MDENSPLQPGHEERDVNVRAVGKFAIGLALLCVVSLLGTLAVFRYFKAQEGGGRAAVESRVPPQPRLQETPAIDLRQIRDAEDQILGGYGWVDRDKGIVRLPIERAMELLAGRGLPARQGGGAQSAAADVSVPTESGLGMKMAQPGGPLAGQLQ